MEVKFEEGIEVEDAQVAPVVRWRDILEARPIQETEGSL